MSQERYDERIYAGSPWHPIIRRRRKLIYDTEADGADNVVVHLPSGKAIFRTEDALDAVIRTDAMNDQHYESMGDFDNKGWVVTEEIHPGESSPDAP